MADRYDVRGRTVLITGAARGIGAESARQLAARGARVSLVGLEPERLEAALEGAKLRFRPVLMTSFAFIFGLLPLWNAEGAGAISRKQMGTAVICGMAAATVVAIFIIPMLFVVVERLAGAEKKPHAEAEGSRPPAPVPAGPEP